MFAFALWDKQDKALYLARDRMGEKPLYYGWQGETFLFGSELKALKAHPGFIGEIDRDALALFLRYNYVPGPYSIYKGIKKLTAGNFLKVYTESKQQEELSSYWNFSQVAETGIANPFVGNDADALNLLEDKLAAAVKGQMLSDVPLGALLSGGIDSSLVCALMQAQSSTPIKTFTIGVEDKAYDEAGHARAVAEHLGTEHTELYLKPNDVLDIVPQMPDIYDEPFSDPSQLPTYLVMKLVKEHVSVALSGDAGDEIFAGYDRYTYAPMVWQHLGGLPQFLINIIASSCTAVPASTINKLAKGIGIAQLGDKSHKLGQRLRNVGSLDDLYLSLVSQWNGVSNLVVDGQESQHMLGDRQQWPGIEDPVARMMALDSLSYLPDDILVKVDRAAMAVSLETRTPFLDKDVIEFAWQLPTEMKLRDGKGKWLLRQLLDKYVPRELIDRPKMGFAIPLDDWLRGPLRDWAETLLAEDRLQREGYLNPQPIRKAWNAHCSGKASYGFGLWSVLMFQAWLEKQ